MVSLVKPSVFDDKVFLVTGGAAGVGAGVVKALLCENARHVAFLDVADREGSALELQLLNKFGALRAKFIKCDISDDDQLSSAYKQVLDKYRRLDGVVNCAAVLSSDERAHKLMVDINFHGVFLNVANREGSALELQLLNKFGAWRAKFIKCYISHDDQLSLAYKQVLDKYRRLDRVVNCATVLNYDERAHKLMFDINFTATVNSTYKALVAMGLDRGGNGGVIVNISSLLALNLGTHLPVYSATKAAVLQFSIAMGAEEYHSKTGVRVLTVCLGPTDTAILHRRNSENFDKKSAELLTSRVPVRQRVESAVTGILEVIHKGKSGTTWIVKNDMPPFDHTANIVAAFDVLSTG